MTESEKLETIVDLEAMLHRAARHGARDALREIGLGDSNAGEDVRELRDWLSNVKIFRRVFKETTAKVFTAGFWLVLTAGVVAYFREHFHG